MADLRVELPPFSMFAKTPLYSNIEAEVEGEKRSVAVFGLMVDAVVPHSTDQIFQVPQSAANRLDRLSTWVYGTPELWPVLARVNNVEDPLVGLAVGAQFQAPTKARLAAEGLLNV